MDRDAERAIEWDCNKLLNQFYRLLDDKKYEALANLFADDGVWMRLGEELNGPAAILDAMGEREDWLTAHLLSNVQIEVSDPDHATSSQYVTLYRIEGYDPSGGPAEVTLPMGILRHRDQLVRIDNHWKFQRKESRAVLVNRKRVTHYDR